MRSIGSNREVTGTSHDTLALEAHDLGKRYRHAWALRACHLAIRTGRFVALVGRNGAGKTTLLHLAIGLLRPSEGVVRVCGRAPREDRLEVLMDVGFVAQEHPLFGTFTVAEMLEAGRRLNRRWDGAGARARIEHFALPLRQRVRQLSGGQQAQVALTLALAKRPRMLVLDEPVASLDPLARSQFLRELADAARNEGLTVILSSHILAELERVCDYMVIINRGRIQLAAPVNELRASHRVHAGPVPDGATTLALRLNGTRLLRMRQPTENAADPALLGDAATLEDVVLAYLENPSLTAPRSAIDVHA